MDTAVNPPASEVTAANGRAQVAELAAELREVTGGAVGIALVDQGHTGESAAERAGGQGIEPDAVKQTEAEKGFVPPPRRVVVERTFGWLGRFRRLTRDCERLATTPAEWHWPAGLQTR